MTQPLLLHSMLSRLNVDIGRASDLYMPCLEQAVGTCAICANTETCRTWLLSARLEFEDYDRPPALQLRPGDELRSRVRHPRSDA